MTTAAAYVEKQAKALMGLAGVLLVLGGLIGGLAIAVVGGIFVGVSLKIPVFVNNLTGFVAECGRVSELYLHPIVGPTLSPLVAWGLPMGAVAAMLVLGERCIDKTS